MTTKTTAAYFSELRAVTFPNGSEKIRAYKLRAEAPIDIARALAIRPRAGFFLIDWTGSNEWAEHFFTIEADQAGLASFVKALMWTVDAKVARETLQPEEDYTGDRESVFFFQANVLDRAGMTWDELDKHDARQFRDLRRVKERGGLLETEMAMADAYLDYSNNYLTLERYAEDKGISDNLAGFMIAEGRKLQDERAAIIRRERATA